MTAATRILVVEDEQAQAEVLRYNLEDAGHLVDVVQDGDAALAELRAAPPDLVVLDWMLPGLSGIEVCRQIKAGKDTRSIPVLMVTARGEESDRIRGLDTGADDYIVKPYSPAEMVARVRAHLRRARPATAGHLLVHGDVEMDTEQHLVTRGGRSLHLGPTEYRLLTVFLERPGRVWSRSQLLDRAWGQDVFVDERTVDVHIGRLRKVLGKPDMIRTVRGAGYSLSSA